MPHDVDERGHWPRFELAIFPEPTGIPYGWVEELLRMGVPKAMFGYYRAADDLMLLEVPGYGQFVRFGTSGPYGGVCLDPRTRAIVYVNTYVPSRAINPEASGIHGPPSFVNSSLEQFTATVRAVLDRFPFDRGDTGRESWEDADLDEIEAEWDRAAGELTETLGRIDPEAVADQDGFWKTFVADVQMGDYSTDDTLSDPDE